MDVSKSGYYAWAKRKPSLDDDPYEIELLHLIFERSRKRAGAKTMKMILSRNFFILMNLKKIRRLMKKYRLRVNIRRRNKYSSAHLIEGEHATAPNYLDRNFEVEVPETVFCTDITYLDYGKDNRAYLSIVQDVATNEIVHYKLSNNMSLGLAVDGIRDLYFGIKSKRRDVIMVHSDQGSHYTSTIYRKILEDLNILQSMSRRGCSPDNGLIESTFGHLKDEMDYKVCRSYEELEKVVNEYIWYYNFDRPQWGLKAKTPAECRGFKLGAFL